jgi:hypothetical protein
VPVPEVGSHWRHADGGLYEVKNNTGIIKVGNSEWYAHIEYDHADGTVSQGPYHTDAKRFSERFEKVFILYSKGK